MSPPIAKIQETRTYLDLSSFVLATSLKHTPSASRPQGLGLLRLAQPDSVTARAYRGEALRPFGAPLYRHMRRVAPITLQAMRRRPKGRKMRRRTRPYASYLLRKEAPFVEQPVARSTSPTLSKLRPRWLSSWAPNDLRGWDKKLSLRSLPPAPGKRGMLLHGSLLGLGPAHSTWHRVTVFPRPCPGRRPRPRGIRPQALKLWLRSLVVTTSRLARYHSWYQLFSLMPLSLALVAAKAVGRVSRRTPFTTRARSCPQHLILWRDLSLLIRAPYLRRPNSMVLAGIAGIYTKYLVDFFEGYTKAQICLHFVPYSSTFSELGRVKAAINACVYPALKVFHRLFFYKDFATLCAVALHQKNAPLLLTWVTRFMERIDARMHRKFLRFLSVFFRRVHESTSPHITHTGVKFIIKGKISVSGSAKKRTQHIAYGTRSLSRKSHRISFCQGLVRTPTGVLGAKCFIFY